MDYPERKWSCYERDRDAYYDPCLNGMERDLCGIRDSRERPQSSVQVSRLWSSRIVSLRIRSSKYGFGFMLSCRKGDVRPRGNILDSLPYFDSVLPRGAAEKAGICTGDRVLQINGTEVAGATSDFCRSIIDENDKVLTMKILSLNENGDDQRHINSPDMKHQSNRSRFTSTGKPFPSSSSNSSEDQTRRRRSNTVALRGRSEESMERSRTSAPSAVHHRPSEISSSWKPSIRNRSSKVVSDMDFIVPSSSEFADPDSPTQHVYQVLDECEEEKARLENEEFNATPPGFRTKEKRKKERRITASGMMERQISSIDHGYHEEEEKSPATNSGTLRIRISTSGGRRSRDRETGDPMNERVVVGCEELPVAENPPHHHHHHRHRHHRQDEDKLKKRKKKSVDGKGKRSSSSLSSSRLSLLSNCGCCGSDSINTIETRRRPISVSSGIGESTQETSSCGLSPGNGDTSYATLSPGLVVLPPSLATRSSSAVSLPPPSSSDPVPQLRQVLRLSSFFENINNFDNSQTRRRLSISPDLHLPENALENLVQKETDVVAFNAPPVGRDIVSNSTVLFSPPSAFGDRSIESDDVVRSTTPKHPAMITRKGFPGKGVKPLPPPKRNLFTSGKLEKILGKKTDEVFLSSVAEPTSFNNRFKTPVNVSGDGMAPSARVSGDGADFLLLAEKARLDYLGQISATKVNISEHCGDDATSAVDRLLPVSQFARLFVNQSANHLSDQSENTVDAGLDVMLTAPPGFGDSPEYPTGPERPRLMDRGPNTPMDSRPITSFSDETALNSPEFKEHDRFTLLPVIRWTAADAADWLASLGLGEHGESFIRQSVDGVRLTRLDRNGLISLGVIQVTHRMNIERALKKSLTRSCLETF